jgi:hypothetical protein
VAAEVRRELSVGAAGFVGALVVFLPRLAREMVLLGDSSELAAAAVEWGIPHPPGYPLWTALGHLASLLSFGNPVLGVHATSALYHALAVGFVAATTLRLTRSIAAALAAAGALAFAGSFFLGSLYAEVFPLNDLAFAVLLWLGVRIGQTQATRRSWFLAFAGIFGLAAAHQQMIALALPSLWLLARPALGKLDGRTWLTLLAVAASGYILCQLPLAFLARRDPSVNYGEVYDLGSWFRLVTRADYGGLLSATRAASTSSPAGRIGAFAILAWQSLGVVPILFAAFGLLALSRTQRRECLALAVAVLLTGPAFASINGVPLEGEASLAFFERFTSMFLVPLALLVGCGVGIAIEMTPERWQKHAAVGVALVGGLSGLPRAWRIDLSKSILGAQFADDLLLGVPDGALVLITGDVHTSALQYRCATSDACRRITVIAPGQLFLPWKDAQTRRRYPDLRLPEGKLAIARTNEIVKNEIGRRPVFVVPALVTRDPVLSGGYVFSAYGLLLSVHPDEASAVREREPYLVLARAVASGERCRGCRAPTTIPRRPTSDARLLDEYGLALRNMARRAQVFGEPELGKALFARSRSLKQAQRR